MHFLSVFTSPLWTNSATNLNFIPSCYTGGAGGQKQTACLEKLGDKRATGTNSHLELQALIAVINVFSLAAADSFFISCCRCPYGSSYSFDGLD